MAQPQWITPAGSLGTIPEGVFYSVPLQATAGNENVYFRVIAGELPDGVQVTSSGMIEGIPKNVVRVQGVPTEVSEDVTSRFAIRAYTVRVIGGVVTVDRLADRTFEITVAGQDVPDFITPPGRVGTFFDGTEARVQIEFTDRDPNENIRIRKLSGEFPPGMVLDKRTGLISGIIFPLVGPPDTAQAGFDNTEFDQFAWDFSTRAASKNYQFSLEITDGKDSNVRTFEIYVYARNSMTADNSINDADDTFITADVTPQRPPILLTPPGDLGRVRADNFYAFKFEAIDFDGDALEYSVTVGAGIGFDPLPRNDAFNGDPGSYDFDNEGFDRGAFSLPPGLSINPDTGWFYGYIPDQGATEQTYRFAVRVFKRDYPESTSGYYYFTITIIGNIESEVIWLTQPDLGSINNGAVSTFFVAATNVGGRALEYRIAPGSDSKLPQGLQLTPNGDIVGRVSFNTFALDQGTTTFDQQSYSRSITNETTFDLEYEFTVNAFAAQTEQIGYQVSSINIVDGGSGYVSQPTVLISAPPETVDSIQATAGVVTIVGGVITNIAIGNPGRGYLTPPTVTIIGGGGSDAVATSSTIEATLTNAVSVFRRFTINVVRAFNEPYETLYIKAMPPVEDRAIIDQLTQNQDIIPENVVYRADDPNFGVAKSVIYDHAYGLTAATLEDYVSSLDINHYWKYLTLGPIKSARALSPNGEVLYEVVYSAIIDNLVNNQGQSVGKQVTLPYAVELDDSSSVNIVYPNSLDNMRDQVIDTVGQVSPALPLWMTSKQQDGRVLGFTPAWVIAYVKPGESGRVVYNIQQQFSDHLNLIDFKVDRYELDRSQTYNWDSETQSWPSPPEATTFDSYQSFLYTTLFLNTTGVVESTKTYAGDAVTTAFGFEPLINADDLIVTVNGQIQNYYNSSTVSAYSYTVQYATGRPNYSVRNWVSTAAYNAATLVTVGGRYYQARVDVPVDIAISNSFYWTQIEPVNSIVFNTAPPALASVQIYQIRDKYVLDPDSTPQQSTLFDGGSTTFIYPADQWTGTDEFDKYLVFPRTNILG